MAAAQVPSTHTLQLAVVRFISASSRSVRCSQHVLVSHKHLLLEIKTSEDVCQTESHWDIYSPAAISGETTTRHKRNNHQQFMFKLNGVVHIYVCCIRGEQCDTCCESQPEKSRGAAASQAELHFHMHVSALVPAFAYVYALVSA